MSPAETCNHPWIRSRILEACHDVARRYGLNKAETLLAVIITPDEWTPQTGLVTAAQKIQRGKIAQRFSEEIKVRMHRAANCVEAHNRKRRPMV